MILQLTESQLVRLLSSLSEENMAEVNLGEAPPPERLPSQRSDTALTDPSACQCPCRLPKDDNPSFEWNL